MSWDADFVHHQLLEQVLPPGWAFPRAAGSVTGGFLRPLAEASAAFEARAEQLVVETDLRDATDLLADYERVLGPDPCIAAPLPVELRRQFAWRRWISPGGASIAYFEGLGASLGVTVQILEVPVTSMLAMELPAPLQGTPNEFCWEVHLSTSPLTLFTTGASEAGDLLGEFAPSFMECIIRREAPAHTVPLFFYDL